MIRKYYRNIDTLSYHGTIESIEQLTPKLGLVISYLLFIFQKPIMINYSVFRQSNNETNVGIVREVIFKIKMIKTFL